MPWQRDDRVISFRRRRVGSTPSSVVRRARSPVAWLRRSRRWAGIAAFAALAVAALAYPVFQNSSRWSPAMKVRHAAAAPNCAAARAVGLAPAYRGEPGYYPQHDRDGDGIACEPWRRR